MISESHHTLDRQQWMAVLAKANNEILQDIWSSHKPGMGFRFLRKPESGLVMIRGRTGGSGSPFNAGEATVTRCSVQSNQGKTGHAYILGRNHQHAQAAAEIDAALQGEMRKVELMDAIIIPLKELAEEAKQQSRKKAAATKVDFFTIVRGED